ncbi:hypothetical protein [Archangium sp.]|uniref:hypothetical protein n=1 Tax=Archangium sp. TaxID=1872627 RepID=UPI0038D47FB0
MGAPSHLWLHLLGQHSGHDFSNQPSGQPLPVCSGRGAYTTSQVREAAQSLSLSARKWGLKPRASAAFSASCEQRNTASYPSPPYSAFGASAATRRKGVFYERCLLDRYVTALEGANSAGKTTVMIAAYVVLLPDMSRLRFTNLGEPGRLAATRASEDVLASQVVLPTQPSTSHSRARVGSSLGFILRKGEPTVEPTPFIVAGSTRRFAFRT